MFEELTNKQKANALKSIAELFDGGFTKEAYELAEKIGLPLPKPR